MAARKRKKSNKSPRKVARPRTSPDAPQVSSVFLVDALPPLRPFVPVERETLNSGVFVVDALPVDWDASATEAPLDESDAGVFVPVPFTPGSDPNVELPPEFVMSALDLDPEPIACEPWRRPVTLPPSYQQSLTWVCEYGCAGVVTPSNPDGQHGPDCRYWVVNPKATPF